jgi:excisionase family DNA binding protein
MTDLNAQLAEALAALLAAAAAKPTPPPARPETVLSIEEVAERLKVSKSLIYKAIADGQMRSIKIGKRRLVPASEVQRLIEEAA